MYSRALLGESRQLSAVLLLLPDSLLAGSGCCPHTGHLGTNGRSGQVRSPGRRRAVPREGGTVTFDSRSFGNSHMPDGEMGFPKVMLSERCVGLCCKCISFSVEFNRLNIRALN